MRDDFKWNLKRQLNEGQSPINSWERKNNVTTKLVFNVKVSDRDGAPPKIIWWSYWRWHLPPPQPPPYKNNNLRVNFCGGNFDLSGGDNNFLKKPILFTGLVSHTTKTAMKYSGTTRINRSNSCTLCVERGVCTGLGEHMNPWGGFERLYMGQGTLLSTSFVSFKKSAVWHLNPDAMSDKGSQWTLSLVIFVEKPGVETRDPIVLKLFMRFLSSGYCGTWPSRLVGKLLRRPCSEKKLNTIIIERVELRI